MPEKENWQVEFRLLTKKGAAVRTSNITAGRKLAAPTSVHADALSCKHQPPRQCFYKAPICWRWC